MKTIQFELGNGATLALPDDAAAQRLIECLRNESQPAAASRPRIGEYLPGQGGIYIGDFRGDVDTVYGLIMAEPKSVMSMAGQWDAEDARDLSEWDGLDNTRRLRGKSPAATLASDYEADGHHDFYLPSRRETMIALGNVPQLFKDDWYWTSTTYSEHHTWAVYFGLGKVGYYFREHKLCVHPFRRIAGPSIQSIVSNET